MVNKEKILELFQEIQEISDLEVQQKVINCWLMALQDSPWDSIEAMPWIPGRADFISNVQHTRGVARIGIAIVKTIISSQDVAPDVKVDLDTVIAGCLLHDVGKLLEYAGPSNNTGQKTSLGNTMGHNILGAHLAIKAGLDAEIVHCIEAHREPEFFKKSYEALIVRLADHLHAYAMVTTHPDAELSWLASPMLITRQGKK